MLTIRDARRALATAEQKALMIFAGGFPRERDGEVVGAVEVSGGPCKQDQAVADTGAAAF